MGKFTGAVHTHPDDGRFTAATLSEPSLQLPATADPTSPSVVGIEQFGALKEFQKLGHGASPSGGAGEVTGDHAQRCPARALSTSSRDRLQP